MDLISHMRTNTSTVYLEDLSVIYGPKAKCTRTRATYWRVISHDFFVSPARYYVLVVLTDGEIEVQLGSASLEAWEVTVWWSQVSNDVRPHVQTCCNWISCLQFRARALLGSNAESHRFKQQLEPLAERPMEQSSSCRMASTEEYKRDIRDMWYECAHCCSIDRGDFFHFLFQISRCSRKWSISFFAIFSDFFCL